MPDRTEFRGVVIYRLRFVVSLLERGDHLPKPYGCVWCCIVRGKSIFRDEYQPLFSDSFLESLKFVMEHLPLRELAMKSKRSSRMAIVRDARGERCMVFMKPVACLPRPAETEAA